MITLLVKVLNNFEEARKTWKTSLSLTKISNKLDAVATKSASQQISGGEPGQIICGMYLSLPRKRKTNCD